MHAHLRPGVPSDDRELLVELRRSWPPAAGSTGRGYRAPDLAGLEPLAALRLAWGDRRMAAAVVEDARGGVAVLPLAETAREWRLAVAGDGVSEALLGAMAISTGSMRFGSFTVDALDASEDPAGETALEADQSNTSVVVGGSTVVKWLTAAGTDGSRAALLRRHLRAVGFTDAPRLIGTLTWQRPTGGEVVLAQVDEFLAGGEDGWDHLIAALGDHVRRGHRCERACAADLVAPLGALTARLHAALATPSRLIPEPVASASEADRVAWSRAGLQAVDLALDIDAEGRSSLAARSDHLRRDIRAIAGPQPVATQPIHGDLHIGQLIAHTGGLAVIDFDGPPGVPAGSLPLRQPTERDVAQMLCALDHLAVVVDHRTGGAHTTELRTWARHARGEYLGAYALGLGARSGERRTDADLVAGFIAAQLCRELIYAADVLPRWRYAPLTAIAWRYPEIHP